MGRPAPKQAASIKQAPNFAKNQFFWCSEEMDGEQLNTDQSNLILAEVKMILPTHAKNT